MDEKDESDELDSTPIVTRSPEGQRAVAPRWLLDALKPLGYTEA